MQLSAILPPLAPAERNSEFGANVLKDIIIKTTNALAKNLKLARVHHLDPCVKEIRIRISARPRV